MEGIHSYEQKSEFGSDAEFKQQNRVIIVNRRNPDCVWSTSNLPTRSSGGSSWFVGIKRKIRWNLRGRHQSRGPGSKVSISSVSSMQYDTGPFASNEWITSRYTLFNFLPKNLFEQFRRLANFYFLVTAVLQLLLPYSPVGPTTSLLPLVFVVSVTSIKQAYEDYLRHKLDSELNNRSCNVLRGKKLTRVRSKDIRVGDFVYVSNNEEIPCDMILLASSGTGARCHITTANLDGETSLKTRTCSSIEDNIGKISDLNRSVVIVECEQPNATLYEFHGLMRVPRDSQTHERLLTNLEGPVQAGVRVPEDEHDIISTVFHRAKRGVKLPNHAGSGRSEMHEIPLDLNNLLLRASRLRNTNHIYGLAIYTGPDTKLAHNSHVKPNKFSSSEDKVNLYLLIAFGVLLLLSVLSAWRYVRPTHWYYEGLDQADSFLQMLAAHFLLYNYLVPISLYVTLEFIKFLGTVAVVEDKRMQAAVWQHNSDDVRQAEIGVEIKNDSKLDVETSDGSSMGRMKVVEGPKCNSSDLNEELGQVEVLFTDKTGTLTENKMRFMACSAYGDLYRTIGQQLYKQPAHMFTAPIPNIHASMLKIGKNRHAHLAASNVLQSAHARAATASYKSPGAPIIPPHMRPQPPDSANSLHSGGSAPAKPFDHRNVPPLSALTKVHKLDDNHSRVAEFFMCLCLCTTISLNETIPLADCLPDKIFDRYDYQSASPDEQSLISAAHAHGITLCKSNDNECYIVIPRSATHITHQQNAASIDKKARTFKPIVDTKESTEKYIVRHFRRLMTLEFNSVRKRMSVLYRDCDNDCILMVTKGSEELLDCIRLQHLNKDMTTYFNLTIAHFEAFAKSGLRTMLVARRIIGKSEYESLAHDMREAQSAIHNRDYMVNEVHKRAERDLMLIGSTAVEDMLQKGVAETIDRLKDAGIKVWLLTGDKVETAISVAYLCKLLDNDMYLFHLVRQQDVQSCQRLLATFEDQLEGLQQDTHRSIGNASSFRSNASDPSAGQSKHASKHSGKAHKKSANKGAIFERFALIADGRSLHYAMKYAKRELEQICKSCVCVLGCRLSPLQKAEIVAMIKRTDEKPITCAIGDGANDVSMIQEAHVGIGIRGKEGRQAVNSSDFAINRFYMLNRLLFVHGHLFYHRAANTIHYFFYKNFLFIVPQFLYSFYNLSSAQSLYHPVLLIGFNLFYTSLPILIYGLHEKHIPEPVLEQYPILYQLNRGNSQMTIKVYMSWILLAVLQAVMGFYFLYFNWGSHTPFLETGKMAGLMGFSVKLYTAIVFASTFRLCLLAQSHTYKFILSCVASCVLLPVSLYGYSFVDWSFVFEDNSFYGTFVIIVNSGMFWIAIATTSLFMVLPDIVSYVQHRVWHLQRIGRAIQQGEIEPVAVG